MYASVYSEDKNGRIRDVETHVEQYTTYPLHVIATKNASMAPHAKINVEEQIPQSALWTTVNSHLFSLAI